MTGMWVRMGDYLKSCKGTKWERGRQGQEWTWREKESPRRQQGRSWKFLYSDRPCKSDPVTLSLGDESIKLSRPRKPKSLAFVWWLHWLTFREFQGIGRHVTLVKPVDLKRYHVWGGQESVSPTVEEHTRRLSFTRNALQRLSTLTCLVLSMLRLRVFRSTSAP